MPASNAWDETSPLGSDLASSIDDFMRGMKLDVRERMGVQHYWNVSTTADGAHKSIDIPSAANGGTAAGESVRIGRNTDGSGAAGTLRFVDKDGVVWYVWMDAGGILRRHPLPPTADGVVGDTDGTPIGSADGTLTFDLVNVTNTLNVGGVAEIGGFMPLAGWYFLYGRGNVINGVGIGTIGGTLAFGTLTQAGDANDQGVMLTTGTGALNGAGGATAFSTDYAATSVMHFEHDFDFRIKVTVVDIERVVLRVGLSTIGVSPTGHHIGPLVDGSPSWQFAGFQYVESTGVARSGDPGWMAVCQDGPGVGTVSAGAILGKDQSGFAIDSGTYILRMRRASGIMYFSVDNDGTGFGDETAITTHLPAGDYSTFMVEIYNNVAVSGTAKSLLFHRAACAMAVVF